MEVLALDAAIKEWNGDTRRVYLTGLSMGGFGSWDIATRHTKKFAAVVPICGGISRRDYSFLKKVDGPAHIGGFVAGWLIAF